MSRFEGLEGELLDFVCVGVEEEPGNGGAGTMWKCSCEEVMEWTLKSASLVGLLFDEACTHVRYHLSISLQ